MKRTLAAFLVLAASFAITWGQPPSAPAAAAQPISGPDHVQAEPPPETLRDLRIAVAQGKLKGTAALCDRLRGTYEAQRAILLGSPEIPNNRNQAAVETYMACYCIYAKSQVLALTGDAAGAAASLTEARSYRAKFPEFGNPRVQEIIQEMDIITAGLLQERSGQLDSAVQTYLPATYQAGTDAPIATGRLALIELKRGHTDRAQSWAYIHADDPTSQFVLAQLALQKKNLMVAQRHATTAIGLLQKQLRDGKEYMPVFFVETPAIRVLSKKLPPLPAPPKPAAPPPAAAADASKPPGWSATGRAGLPQGTSGAPAPTAPALSQPTSQTKKQ